MCKVWFAAVFEHRLPDPVAQAHGRLEIITVGQVQLSGMHRNPPVSWKPLLAAQHGPRPRIVTGRTGVPVLAATKKAPI